MIPQMIFCLLFVTMIGPAAQAGADAESREMDGTWKTVTAELAGQQWPQKLVDSITLIVKDENYTVLVGEARDEGTVKRDSAKTPKTMDITGKKGPNEGKTLLTIYELKGDELRVCYDLSGKSRPTEFATKPDTQLFLVKYKRAKP